MPPEETSIQKSVDGLQQNKGNLALTALKYARAGTPGGALRLAAKRATGNTISNKAEALAGKTKARFGNPSPEQEKRKKLTGPAFYMVLGLTIFKDLSDVFLDATVFLSIFTLVTGMIISFIVVFYLYYNEVTPTWRKVVTWIISLVIESFPPLNLLPTASIELLLIRFFENSELVKKVASNPVVGKVLKDAA